MLLNTQGLPVQPRAQMPGPTNLQLPNGRVLAYRGEVPGLCGMARGWITLHGLTVLASLDETQHGLLLHVSISHPRQDPTWTEIRAVRDLFYPDTIDVMMVLPQKADYVNLDTHCFHLWQTPVEWAVQ